ncbi:MAG: cuyA [Verrucomicrobiales bacterium]|nr:cuyA [Verrucomicrobiales bacterium]
MRPEIPPKSDPARVPWDPLPAHRAGSLLQSIDLPQGTITVQRDDLLHPLISGNKWRKLAGWLRSADIHNQSTLLTYGGAFSNHLVATACAAQATGRRSIGILRGEEPMDNPHLRIARDHGMEMCQVSRAIYRDKAAALDEVRRRPAFENVDWSRVLIIPEGGCGPEGFVGFHDLVASWQKVGLQPAAVLHASATATTATGLALALEEAGFPTIVLAVPVLHNKSAQQEFAAAHGVTGRIRWITGYEGAGYAKSTPALQEFCQDFTARHGIPCEPVYSGKALHALTHLLETGALSPEGLVFLHTGGVL